MKMTADEIFAMYDKNRSRETMQKIADLNDCTIKEVGEFLKDVANRPKRKPGRPKKEKAEEPILTGIEETKKDKTEESENKVVSEPVKNSRHSYMIPEVVVEATREKIAEARRKAKYYEEKAEEYNLIVLECEDFLEGGWCSGTEDGLYRQVQAQ